MRPFYVLFVFALFTCFFIMLFVFALFMRSLYSLFLCTLFRRSDYVPFLYALFLRSFYLPFLFRLVFSRFLDLRGSLGNIKEKLARKTCFSRQNLARLHFFDVNKVSTVFSWKIDIKTGESNWKGLITKVLWKLYKNTLENAYNNL